MNETYLKFAKEIAYGAGKIMLKYFNEDNKSYYKEDETIVTKADNEINSYLIRKVKEKFPNHSVDGEEEQFGKSNYVWVCDPIDGTAMYARHIPVAVFSLALVVDGFPQIGVIYDPFTDNLYHAIKGKGAYQNNQKIQVNNLKLNDKRNLSHIDMNFKSKYQIYDIVKKISKKTNLTDIGSIARACTCVATGDFTFAIFTGTIHKNCDVAAAKVIIEESGGMVTDLFGSSQRYDTDIKGAVLSNGIVHKEVIKIIKKYIKEN